jgi:NAD(P)-dependent dehydrogenase (short-subunit alcohol dehydrogenase family)
MEFGGGKVAIITGGSRGIGAGLVEAFHKHGYRVIANSRTITDSPHPEVASVAGDIADPTTSERLVSGAVAARFGRIDTLINNAGVFLSKPFVFYTAGAQSRSKTDQPCAARSAWTSNARSTPHCKPIGGVA